MLSKKLLQGLNDQINFEFYSSYTYLAMAGYCESIDLSGFANFFRVQAKEELDHAMKLYDYVYQKNGSVVLEQVNKPQGDYDGIIDVFEKGYEHEQLVTRKIYELTDIAYEEREHSTISLLKWFIDEQVEEENNFNSLVKRVRRIEDNPAGLYLMDDELATRVYTTNTNN
ncbi:ferritin [Clostridium sartagoforme]|uniref:Ferritin n=1 Tax=Clostridium sartagoforme TaxID=84031 RepID=A0A4S2DNX6_9CLOT|nr:MULTISPECIES: ferritin [Clostridium]MBS5937597.1 ferritin [Clostridium sp.]TGY44107.1 ferritin [Clostridium sartagoforme]